MNKILIILITLFFVACTVPTEPQRMTVSETTETEPQSGYINNHDGTTTHNEIMVTQYPFEDNLMTWQEAKNYAQNLNHAGYNDWRLPTKQEILSLTGIQTEEFRTIVQSYGIQLMNNHAYWTSTQYDSEHAYVICTAPPTGATTEIWRKTDKFYVWVVR